MQSFLARSKAVAFLAVFGLLLSSFCCFLLGLYKSFEATWKIVSSIGHEPLATLYFVQIVDDFVVATTLFIFAVSIYELFLGKLALPDWMLAHSLFELETKLGSLVILVLSIKFLEKFIMSDNALSVLFYALSVAVVSATLIAFAHFGSKK